MRQTITIKTLKTILCAVAILCGTSAFAKDFPPQARQALRQAQSCIKEEDMGGADKILDEYLQNTNETPPAEVFIMQGAARNDRGNKAGALAAFLNGMKLYPQNKSLCHNSAVLLYEQNNYLQAARLFERIYDLTAPKEPRMLYHAGAAFYEGKKYGESARAMSRLLTATQIPKKEWIKLALHSYLQAGQPGKALNYLDTLLKNYPQEAEYWKLLAKVEMDRNRYVQAAAALEMGYSLSPPTDQENRQLIQIYKYINAPLKAAKTMNRIHAGKLTPEQAQELALLYDRAGQPQDALKLIENSLGSTPAKGDRQQLLVTKGKLLYSLRRYGAATEIFSLCLRTQHNPEARFFRALCFWELKQWELSRKDFLQLAGLKKYQARAQRALAALSDLEEAKEEADKG
ncbi:tetratricopeptide repeat protein [Maridesulfovibrio sp.]|uniref:tetratricopeptide repeat protein n=1 Tax=unclassified Maridesulfovibrio TaxID=2794999 RepID=UPI003B003CA9